MVSSAEMNEKSIQNANEMLVDNFDDYTYEDLLKLAKEGSLESDEELNYLAEQYDIVPQDGQTREDLAMRIWQAMENEADNKYN